MPKLIDISSVAESIPLNATNTSYKAEDIRTALIELRQQVIREPEFTTTTTSGTKSLTNTSYTLQVFSGSATGFVINLPDASTLFEGRKFEIANQSSQSIQIKDGSGILLLTLNQDSILLVTLEDNSTTAGSWLFIESSTTATGIVSANITSDTTFMTSATTPTLITGFSTTPTSGTYAVWFSSDLTITSNNNVAECSVYVDGTQNTNTIRNVQGTSSNYQTNFQSLGRVSVNGAQAVDVRVRVASGGGSITVGSRSLLLIRLGSV